MKEPVLEGAELADMRSRICAGMKRFFHTKSMEGLLSRAVRVHPATARPCFVHFIKRTAGCQRILATCHVADSCQQHVAYLIHLTTLIQGCSSANQVLVIRYVNRNMNDECRRSAEEACVLSCLLPA